MSDLDSPSAKRPQVTARTLGALAEIDPSAWDRLANPPGQPHNPFVSYVFLQALEEAGCVSRSAGWQPLHLLLEDEAVGLAGALPLYVKSHSQGEFVFDYGWAHAFEQAGGQYYPKLQCSVPFTPVTGPRLLAGAGPDAPARRRQLAAGARSLAEKLDVSSLHMTFLQDAEYSDLGSLGFLQRTDQQFHWHNDGYECFDDFLSALSSSKRKNIRKERRGAVADGLDIRWLTGSDIQEHHWDAFFAFYMDTGARKWGHPYLNRMFFSLIGERMADRLLLVLCYRGDHPIAGALNIIGDDTLYGRYWGCAEDVPFLHFETCYYQAMDFAIAHKLPKVEAGAQGMHKLARGYAPVTTYSAHWITHPGLRQAVADYLQVERTHTEEEQRLLVEHLPFRKG